MAPRVRRNAEAEIFAEARAPLVSPITPAFAAPTAVAAPEEEGAAGADETPLEVGAAAGLTTRL